MHPSDEGYTVLEDVLARARAAGAEAADAVLVEATSLSHRRRLGVTERLERAEARDLGLRVLVGRRQAVIASSDWAPERLDEIAERAVAMARAVPEDPDIGLAEPDRLFAGPMPDLDSVDPVEPDAQVLIDSAAACEEAALAVGGVTNSEGAEASYARWRVMLAATNGFRGTYANTRHGLGVHVIAGEGTGMEGAYDASSKTHRADLTDAAEIGRSAGARAVARLGPGRVKTGRMPVVFENRIAGGMIANLASAVNGAAIARGASFLKDRMDQKVFPEGMTVWDDPLRPRGLKSKPFDAEGLPTAKRAIVENGRLTTWLLDLRTARKLGLAPTGHAARGAAGPPSPGATNLVLPNGSKSLAELIEDIEEGVFVTSLFGHGANLVTGDYSRGAAGFRIQKGEITTPVNELTIAGNLAEMFLNMEAADDLELRFGTDAPSLRIEGMTVAGQ